MATLYFYKGTPFGQWEKTLSYENAMTGGKEQIALGLRRSGLSLEQQATEYLQQLDIIEDSFVKYAKGGEITRKVIAKVAKAMDLSIDKLYAMWCINICSLLIMKKLENDNMNGIMTISN
jgi:hypothetical protein